MTSQIYSQFVLGMLHFRHTCPEKRVHMGESEDVGVEVSVW